MQQNLEKEIAKYLTPKTGLNVEQAVSVSGALEELSKQEYGIEREAYEKVLRQKALVTYPRISIEFLRLSAMKEYKRHDYDSAEVIKVPRFSIYTLDNPCMKVCFGYSQGNGFFFGVEEPNGLPKALIKNLAMSTEMFTDGNNMGVHDWGYRRPWPTGLPKDTKRKYKERIGAVSLTNTFRGIIPIETKKKISEAEKLFGRKNIFLFAETSPEDWAIKEFVSKGIFDPLIVGKLWTEFFYIDKFDPTPLEDYVSCEFTG